jgi:MFS family permease
MVKKKQTRKKSPAKTKKSDKKVKSLTKNKLPNGVKIVSLLYYMWAILWVGFGILVAIGAPFMITYLIELFPQLEAVRYGALVVLGIIAGLCIVALGVFEYFVARGLWRLKPLARVIAIILSSLAIVNSVIVIASGFQAFQMVRLFVDGGIIAYLFSREARELYK